MKDQNVLFNALVRSVRDGRGDEHVDDAQHDGICNNSGILGGLMLVANPGAMVHAIVVTSNELCAKQQKVVIRAHGLLHFTAQQFAGATSRLSRDRASPP